ncbi:MAG: DUF6519 domain-containing protein [Pyrinomonadaceae bacterium]
MKGDFSRDTFAPLNHFSRVLMQQGRVLLDSDLNEQTAILLHYLRTLAADLIGPFGGPQEECGFNIAISHLSARDRDPQHVELLERVDKRNFLIEPGRYYVNGLLCENEHLVTYARPRSPWVTQPHLAADELENGRSYLVYLVAWEQHLTSLEDERIREVALGAHGPDTATRTRVVWQVRTWEFTVENVDLNDDFSAVTCERILIEPQWGQLVKKWQPLNRGQLRAKADEPDDTDFANPCLTSPDARYRGAENQLYRVEIHQGATATDPATFKWSRENGYVLLPVRSVAGKEVTLEHLGRDTRTSVQIGDWVELVDDDYDLLGRPEALLQITDIKHEDMIVTLSGTPATTRTDKGGRSTPRRNQLLRRWDQKAGDPNLGGLELRDGAAIIKERTSGGDDNWLALEDGVQIQFQGGGHYRPGDYWLIPARTETGDVEWPGAVGNPEAQPPHGITYYYAPLARITVSAGGDVNVEEDYRRQFDPLADCLNPWSPPRPKV